METQSLSLPKRWTTILQGCNLPGIENADFISKWLVISRSCVLSMTVTSGAIGLLVALEGGPINWGYGLLALLGLAIAHLSNNIINDYTDVKMGVDTEDYPRAQYSVHPLLGGLTTPRGLLTASALLLAADAAIMVVIAFARGWPVVWLALGGLVLSLTYTGILKRFALGELTALIVWGPLMIAGVAFVAAGSWDWNAVLLSLPYGLVVASVLVGKHMDKVDADREVGVRTLPAFIGNTGSAYILKIASVGFYAIITVLVVLRITGPWILISLLAIIRLIKAWKAFGKPKPSEPPEGWTVWPLWYVGWAMYFNRSAGLYFVIGMIFNVLIPRIIAAVG